MFAPRGGRPAGSGNLLITGGSVATHHRGAARAFCGQVAPRFRGQGAPGAVPRPRWPSRHRPGRPRRPWRRCARSRSGAWAFSSGGKSARLITVRSVVRVHKGPRAGDVAQLGEHLLCTQGVGSSSLPISTAEVPAVPPEAPSAPSHANTSLRIWPGRAAHGPGQTDPLQARITPGGVVGAPTVMRAATSGEH